ncbi:Protein tilB [Irineochytrium annulatum]|nr:Protein tilB [Irineochytrium annulatum]
MADECAGCREKEKANEELRRRILELEANGSSRDDPFAQDDRSSTPKHDQMRIKRSHRIDATLAAEIDNTLVHHIRELKQKLTNSEALRLELVEKNEILEKSFDAVRRQNDKITRNEAKTNEYLWDLELKLQQEMEKKEIWENEISRLCALVKSLQLEVSGYKEQAEALRSSEQTYLSNVSHLQAKLEGEMFEKKRIAAVYAQEKSELLLRIDSLALGQAQPVTMKEAVIETVVGTSRATEGDADFRANRDSKPATAFVITPLPVKGYDMLKESGSDLQLMSASVRDSERQNDSLRREIVQLNNSIDELRRMLADAQESMEQEGAAPNFSDFGCNEAHVNDSERSQANNLLSEMLSHQAAPLPLISPLVHEEQPSAVIRVDWGGQTEFSVEEGRVWVPEEEQLPSAVIRVDWSGQTEPCVLEATERERVVPEGMRPSAVIQVDWGGQTEPYLLDRSGFEDGDSFQVTQGSPIESLTQTMIGSWFQKYNRHGKNPKLRFFWVNPYTRFLNWAPAPLNQRRKGPTKTAYIEDVLWAEVPETHKNYPPNVEHALTIKSDFRTIIIVPTSWSDHQTWPLVNGLYSGGVLLQGSSLLAGESMAVIDEKLIRRRSEHNDGEISSLREITLHQFDIERIENLDIYCRNLEILFLQNNLISKIENLSKLKRLKYLNLALNNITVLENLEGCESLSKLDLTVNFIWNPLDLESLKSNIFLEELFLVGNPITKTNGYREHAIITLPQLKVRPLGCSSRDTAKTLDGKEVEKSERLQAKECYAEIHERFKLEEQLTILKKEDRKPAVMATDVSMEELQEEFKTKVVPHTPETRLQAAKDVERMKSNGKKEPVVEEPKEHPLFGPDGRVLQCNQGRWDYVIVDTGPAIRLDLEVSKFLDSSLIDVEIRPTYLRVKIKKKLLQLALEERIFEDEVLCERSRLTGHLVITMMKERRGKDHDITTSVTDYVIDVKRRNAAPKNVVGAVTVQAGNKRAKRLGLTVEEGDGKRTITEVKVSAADIKPDDGFYDDPDVPPLC